MHTEGLASARAVLAEAARATLAPRERLTPAAWTHRYRHVQGSSSRGPWDRTKTPYLDEIMDAAADPRIRQITIVKGSQVGGTEVLYNVLFWAIDQRPGLTLLVYPDQGSARTKNRLRLLPEIRGTPKVADLLSTRKADISSGLVRFRSMDLLFAGTVSEHQLESWPCRLVLVDELDRCTPGTAHLARQRTKTFPDGLMIVAGKPGLAGEGIDLESQTADQRRYWVPCPHCGVYHLRRFGRVRWYGLQRDGTMGMGSRDVTLDGEMLTQVRRTAWLKCPHCNGACEAAHNRWQLCLGVWLSKTQSVTALEPSGNTAAKDARLRWRERPGEVTGERPDSEHVAFFIPEWNSGLIGHGNPYGDAAEHFVRLKGKVDAAWVQDHAGEGWRVTGRAPEVSELRRAVVPAAEGGHMLGTVPAGVLVLVAGVDVQEAGCYLTVRGFGERGIDSWLVWHEYVPAKIGLGLGALDAVLYARAWRRTDGKELKIYARGIDSGQGVRTEEIYEYCRRRQRCFAVKGVGRDARGQPMDGPHRWSRPERGPDGKPLHGGVWLLRVNTSLWKETLSRKMAGGIMARATAASIAAGPLVEMAADLYEDDDEHKAGAGITPEEMRTAASKIGRFILPVDVTDDYLEQVTAEELVEERTKRGQPVRGRTQFTWKLRPGRSANHYLDAEVYAFALADACGIRNVTAAGVQARGEQQAAPTREPAQRSEGSMLRQGGESLLRSMRRRRE